MKTIKIKLPSIEEVTFRTICREEDMPIEGNVMASGNDAIDRKAEKDIYEQLENGNEWAWCCVEVQAEWRGLVGNDFLGGCSYDSQKDFEEPGGYYDDMKVQAYDDLIAQLRSLE